MAGKYEDGERNIYKEPRYYFDRYKDVNILYYF